jgi:hypothetical protein
VKGHIFIMCGRKLFSAPLYVSRKTAQLCVGIQPVVLVWLTDVNGYLRI